MISFLIRISGIFQALAASGASVAVAVARRRCVLWLSAGMMSAGVFHFLPGIRAQAQSPGSVPAAGASSSSTDPASLTALRQKYQSLLAAAAKPSLAHWQSALEALEKQRIAAGDYDGAARAHEKLNSLRGGQTGGNNGGNGSGAGTGTATVPATRAPVLLRPSQAKLSPGAEFMDAAKEILRIKKAGASLEWELTSVPAGLYEVRLHYGVAGSSDESGRPDPLFSDAPAGPEAGAPPLPPLSPREDSGGGFVEFRRISNLGNGSSLLRRSIRSTGGWASFRTISLGTIELDNRLTRLSLRAADCQAMGLMDMRGIELAPASSSTFPGGAAVPRELTRLKDMYQKSFNEQTRALNTRYLKNLTEFEAQIAHSKDTDTLAMVRQEKKRLERGGDSSAQAPMEFTLPVNDSLAATIRGEARLTSQKDYLIRLRPAGGCEIIWKLTRLGIPPGTYKVHVDCRLTQETGGSAVLFSMASGGNAPDPGLNIKIPGNGAEVPQMNFSPGTVTIAKGSDHLFLRVTALEKKDGSLCDLKNLRLSPVPAS